ncbi:hypothetical protein GJ496_006907 [Pomphorhynchus laevis]|nr:hypothetical protein GJ496_006907 [Pomphorhynchus laevis]
MNLQQISTMVGYLLVTMLRLDIANAQPFRSGWHLIDRSSDEHYSADSDQQKSVEKQLNIDDSFEFLHAELPNRMHFKRTPHDSQEEEDELYSNLLNKSRIMDISDNITSHSSTLITNGVYSLQNFTSEYTSPEYAKITNNLDADTVLTVTEYVNYSTLKQFCDNNVNLGFHLSEQCHQMMESMTNVTSEFSNDTNSIIDAYSNITEAVNIYSTELKSSQNSTQILLTM